LGQGSDRCRDDRTGPLTISSCAGTSFITGGGLQVNSAKFTLASLGTDGQLQIDAGAVYQQVATGGTSVEIVIVNNGVFTIAQDDLYAIAGASGAGEWIVGTGTNPSTHRKSVHHVQLWWRHFWACRNIQTTQANTSVDMTSGAVSVKEPASCATSTSSKVDGLC
jgi:hypothetical protein